MRDCIPTFTTDTDRRRLVSRFGLPNAYPRPEEGPLGAFRTRRELFVDDDEHGRPVAIFDPA